MIRFSFACLAMLFGAACSTLPSNIEREPSYALENPETTTLGQDFLPQVAARDGKSGFVPVVAGTNAFLLRAAMAGLAQHTLDLQYYIWQDDLTGRLMLRDILRAADRGVRVRVLLDDIDTEGDTRLFTRADAHPNVEVRLFNPFARRDLRVADWLLDGARLNHRMHNKAMIADNAIAIAGGRNIGDHYFTVDEISNFRDLDLLAIGPIVQDLSSMFDLYWNSEWSFPIVVFDSTAAGPEDARKLSERLHRSISVQPRLPFPLDRTADEMRARLLSHVNDFAWGNARAVFDNPAQIESDVPRERRVAAVLFDSANGVRHELLIETAYLVPGENAVELLGALVDRGVKVSALTNSLATNDVIAAHAGYMDYRKGLLQAGVELFELRPDALAQQRQLTVLASDSEAALHTKALVYDRNTVFVGSFNLDPRSLLINMEMGVLVESPELAVKVADIIRTGMRPANSYQVLLRDGDIRWRHETDDGLALLKEEPETSCWERFAAGFISLLPINGQL